jgi:hypothetical protein
MAMDTLQFELSDKNTKTEPGPGEKPRSKRGRPRGSGTGARVETQLRDELTTFLKFTSLLWSAKDPECGPILNQQSELIAADLAKWASKSKWAKQWIEQTAQLGELIPFLIHVQPVMVVIYNHHIAPAIERRNGTSEERNEEAPESVPNAWAR